MRLYQEFKIFLIFLIFVFVVFNLVFNLETCSAKEISIYYVGGNGFGNYSLIQDAIDVSRNGDTVFIYNGYYEGNLVIDKSISLIGLDKNSTFIIGNMSLYTILIKSSSVNVSGFTIQNSKMGIYISGPSSLNNNISGNIISENDEGIRLYNSSNNKITSNFINNNTDYGIILYESRNNYISENQLVNNREGIFIGRWSNNNVIYRNNISQHEYGIDIDYSFNNMVCENWIANGLNGVNLCYAKDNYVTNNTIMLHENNGIYLSKLDDNIISPNIFLDNYHDIKEKSSPPKIKAPGFEILVAICAVLLVLFLRAKFLRFLY